MNEINLSGKISDRQSAILKKEKERVDFFSQFDFLAGHNGFRKGNIHLFMGVSHGGKSTLVRSLIVDILCNRPKKKILLWLSEETRLEFLQEFSQTGFTEYSEDQLLIFSEIDNPMGEGKMLQTIENIVISKNVDIVFFDNLTTSKIYMDLAPAGQSSRIALLKKFATNWNVPLAIIAHTGAGITENYSGIISMNDIRGNKTIVNVAQFFYIMQTFIDGTNKISTLRIVKHRGFLVESTIYKLVFIPKAKMFGAGVAIDFAGFSTAYKNRNKL